MGPRGCYVGDRACCVEPRPYVGPRGCYVGPREYCVGPRPCVGPRGCYVGPRACCVGPRPCVGPTAGWRGAEEKNLCLRGDSNPHSLVAPHIQLLYFCSQLAHIVTIFCSALCVILSLKEAVSCSDCHLQPDS